MFSNMNRIYSHHGCVASEWVDFCVTDSVTGYTGVDGKITLKEQHWLQRRQIKYHIQVIKMNLKLTEEMCAIFFIYINCRGINKKGSIQMFSYACELLVVS